jgi:hypothetical protein
VGFPHRLVRREELQEELVLRLLGVFVVAIQNLVPLELENPDLAMGFGGFFVRVPLVQTMVVRGMVAKLLRRRVE